MDIKEQFLDTEFDLHLGFHKTATTYIQSVFSDNRALLAEENMFVPPQRKFRRSYPLGEDIENIVASSLPRSLKGKKLDRLLLIDENLIGTMGSIFESGKLYPRAKQRLENLQSRTSMKPRRIFLSTRNYANYYPSAYAQWITAPKFIPFSAEIVERVLKIDRGWVECIEDISSVFPEAELIIWPYEVFSANQEPIIEMIFDQPDRQLKYNPSEKRNESLSWEAYQVFAFAVELGYKNTELRPFLKNNPFPASTPFAEIFWQDFEKEREQQTERYERDLELINAKFGLQFLNI